MLLLLPVGYRNVGHWHKLHTDLNQNQFAGSNIEMGKEARDIQTTRRYDKPTLLLKEGE
jgi:hypothetical protein